MSKHFLMIVLSLAMIANVSSLTTFKATSEFLQKLPNGLQSVRRRQLDGNTFPLSVFPEQCLPECAPVVTALNGCQGHTACLCTPIVDSSLTECLDCTVNVAPTADIEKYALSIAATYNTVCKGLGLSPISVLSPSGIVNPPQASSQMLSGNFTAITLGSTSATGTPNRSVGTVIANANIGYLSFTVAVTLAALMV